MGSNPTPSAKYLKIRKNFNTLITTLHIPKVSQYFTNTRIRQLLKFAVPFLILVIVLILSEVKRGDQQFSYLAQAFLDGHLYIPKDIGADLVPWHNRYYWALGPAPSLILLPFVGLFSIFNIFFYQGYLQWFFILGTLVFVYKIARKIAYSAEDSLTLSLAFALGSTFVGVASVSMSWYFSQILTTFLLLWSIYEYYSRKRWWLIGILCAFIFMTRITAAPIIIFFGLEIWRLVRSNHQRLRVYAQLFTPSLFAIILLAIYNFARFHNVFEQGYLNQLLVTPGLYRARDYGLLSLSHVPGNIFIAFLGTPMPVYRDGISHVLGPPFLTNNPWGMSVFITSPYLLYLFTLKKKAFDARSKYMIIAIVASMTLIFLYYGIGYYQLGYRYALDFLPLTFVLFMIKYHDGHKKLSSAMNWVLLGSGVVNFYFLLTFWGAI